MKKYSLILASFLTLGIGVAQAALFEFKEQKTGHMLSIEQGSNDEFVYAKMFALNFFKDSYSQIPQDQREFESVEDFINQKFSDHNPRIFEHKKYSFFIVRDGGNIIGYSIFDVIDNDVYTIETQADFATYGCISLMEGLARFIKEVLAPQAKYFIQAARKAVPLYGQILEMCGSVKCDTLHPSIANPAEYYGDENRKNIAQYYQAYKLKLSNDDFDDSTNLDEMD